MRSFAATVLTCHQINTQLSFDCLLVTVTLFACSPGRLRTYIRFRFSETVPGSVFNYLLANTTLLSTEQEDD